MFVLLVFVLLLAWCPLVFAQDKETKETYEKRSEKELQSMDEKINDLKSRAARLKDDAKEDYDAMMAELQDKREQAGKKWQELKEAGSEKWEQAKAEFNSALKDLKDAYERSVARMQKKEGKK